MTDKAIVTAFETWAKDRDLIRTSLSEAFDAGFTAALTAQGKAEGEVEPVAAREQQLEDALRNLMGCYDTPLSRRRYPPDDFMSEALTIARDLLEGSLPQTNLDGNRPLPYDRETLGRFVREAWVRWAGTQPNPKPSWLAPYDELSEPDKEADRQIGESVARWTLIGDAARTAPRSAKRGEVEVHPAGSVEEFYDGDVVAYLRDTLKEVTKERDHFHNQWRACWAPLTPRSENEKQGVERVLAILKSKLSDGGGIVGPSDVQRTHNDFYRGRRVAFDECATMLRSAIRTSPVEKVERVEGDQNCGCDGTWDPDGCEKCNPPSPQPTPTPHPTEPKETPEQEREAHTGYGVSEHEFSSDYYRPSSCLCCDYPRSHPVHKVDALAGGGGRE